MAEKTETKTLAPKETAVKETPPAPKETAKTPAVTPAIAKKYATVNEQDLAAATGAWRAALGIINSGDSTGARQKMALPILEYLEAKIASYGYAPIRDHAVVVPPDSVLDTQTGEIKSS